MLEWMLMPYRRYAEFSGRSRRKEYWSFLLFEVIVIVAALMLMGVLGALTGGGRGAGMGVIGSIFGVIGGLLLIVFVLGSFIPRLAVTVRRLHDTDKSGWMILLGLVPLIGPILVLVFLCTEGTRGANNYGADPKGAGANPDVFA